MPSFVPPRGDWTPEEQAEIDRIRAHCDRYPGWEVECRQADAGDPWCIVYDRDRQRVILHIARIDRSYVVARAGQSRSEQASTMTKAVELALSGLAREEILARAALPARTPRI
jgi:hypothetical protein